jgi:trans-aconitate methyltransferase
MDEPEQVRAYAEADFSEPHELFVALFRDRLPAAEPAAVLDLGCGPCDVTRRFARAYPGSRITAVDGSHAMLLEAERRNAAAGLAPRIEVIEARLPTGVLSGRRFDAVISNSLLHHLADPIVLWEAMREALASGAYVFVMDLLRPTSVEAARALVEAHADGAPEILRRDFFHSLLAAYRPEEVRTQLASAGLRMLTIETVSDRHWIAWGQVSA